MNRFAVYLGGDLAPGRMGEDHELVFVVGNDPNRCSTTRTGEVEGTRTSHVDAVQRLDQIDGHVIQLEACGAGDLTDLDSTYDPGG